MLKRRFQSVAQLNWIKENKLFLSILLIYILYQAGFIFRTSSLINGERYFVLFDDAMVGMRYAKNLAAGYGLVWNPGEYVEGYTNTLWVLYMSLFHLLPITASKISLFIQISGGILLLINLFVVKQIVGTIVDQDNNKHVTNFIIKKMRMSDIRTLFYYFIEFTSIF